MKKTTFLIVLALMIGSLGYSQILGGPDYQTEKPNRDKPVADVDPGIVHILDFIYLPVDKNETSEMIVLKSLEFNDIMKPMNPSEIVITPDKPAIYKCNYSTLQPNRNGASILLKYVRCVRIN